MSYVKWKFKHTPYKDGSYDTALTQDLEVQQPNIQEALGDSRDQFQFKVTNTFGEYNAFFNPRDKIEIYRSYNSDVDEATDLLMVAAVTDAPNKKDHSGNFITVKGYNYSELIANGIVFADPEAAELTIPQAIQQALITLNINTNATQITWDPGNPSVNSSGEPFPIVTERTFYKPFRQLIEKYSSNQYTKDGGYYWYIDRDNYLVWRKKTSEVKYTFNEESDPHKAIDISKDTKDVENFIIIKGGLDPYNKQIQTKVQDFSSSAKHGLRFKMLVDENKYAKEVNDKDMVKAGGTENDGTLPSNIDGFSYPFITTFRDVETGELAVVEDDNDYVSKLRAHVKQYLSQLGKEYLEQHKYGKLEVDITFEAGTRNWGLGDLIEVNMSNVLSSAESGQKFLRVAGINYTTETDRFTLIEDVGTL